VAKVAPRSFNEVVLPTQQARPVLLEPIAYGIKDAALIVGATEFFVGCAIRSGKLPAKKLGKKYVIFRKDLEKFVESAPEAA
jgi:hypothetical protein